LKKRTVIVTGAAGGLGSALTEICSAGNFNVVMLDRDRRGLERAYDAVVDAGLPEPAIYPLDLAGAGPAEYEALVDTVVSEFGGLDALVHCAARFEGLSPLDQVPPQEWLMAVQVNLNAAWLLSVHCLPLLRKARAGKLYFMLEDLERMKGPFWGAYGVSKHGLRALVQQFAAECRSTSIQVLGIDPGLFRSALRARAYHSEHPKKQPAPQRSAEAILDLMEGRTQTAGPLISLAGS
jgi:NAD(P)-dependent dehydrogenase (short-subunit alcohol dehydrogenase family)